MQNPNLNQQQPYYQNQQDDFLTYLVLFAVVGFGIFMFCYFEGFMIFALWQCLMLPVVKFLAWFSNTLLGDLINTLLRVHKGQVLSLLNFMNSVSPKLWHWPGFIAMNAFVGRYLQLPIIPLLSYFLIKLTRTSNQLSPGFKGFVGASRLRSYKLTPNYLALIKNIDDPYVNDIEPALSPVQFALNHGLINLDINKNQITMFDEGKTYQVFSDQLGSEFISLESLKNSDLGWVLKALLNKIPASEAKEKLAAMCARHHYETTVCLGLLALARSYGVVSIQDFLALKKQNRDLWYAFASLGRKVCFVEGAGIVALYNFECTQDKAELKQAANISLALESAVSGLIRAVEEAPRNVNALEFAIDEGGSLHE